MPATRRAYIRKLNQRVASGQVAIKHATPWRTVVLRFLPDGMGMNDVYERMGWSRSRAYSRRRYGKLRLCEAAQLAKAVRASDMGEFLVALALAEGIPNLHEPVALRATEGS